MCNSLEVAILVETRSAHDALVKEYDALVKEAQGPSRIPVGRMEAVAKAQSLLDEWTKMWLARSKYVEEERVGDVEPGSVEARLARRVAKLADQLVEDYEVRSTNPWVAADSATRRSAKVTVYAVLRGVYNEL